MRPYKYPVTFSNLDFIFDAFAWESWLSKLKPPYYPALRPQIQVSAYNKVVTACVQLSPGMEVQRGFWRSSGRPALRFMELITILKGVELFRGLSVEQLQRLVNISQKEVYQADQVVFDQGTAGDKMYVIAQGEVEVRVKGETGSKQTMVYLGRGQLFGEMALLDQSERSATVVAAQDNTVLYAISNGDFLNLCTSDTGVGYVMMRNMAMDLSFKLRRQNTSGT